MVFSSPIFLFLFLPACLLAYLLTNIFGNVKVENICLFIFSLVFYAYGNIDFLPILLVSIAVNFLLSKFIDVLQNENIRFILFVVSLVLNIGILFVYKYLNLFSGFLLGAEYATSIKLPIGISFYTFQVLSYLIDVHRRDVKPCDNILDFALFVMLFPQLIAGPIVRYSDIELELKNRRSTFNDFSEGIFRFMVGFTKKILFANAMGKITDLAFSQLGYYSMGPLISALVIICYSMQIYLDFSAYSDMAIGIGRVFGFHFPENFNNPFVASSMREFWNRWHISLSTFFKDYVYIPLGGNRCGIVRTCINHMIVFTLSGFWHGASFNFMFWGIFHGVLIVIEKLFLSKYEKHIPKTLGILYVFFLWTVGMILFRLENMNDVVIFVKGFFKPAMFNYIARDLVNEVFNPKFIFCFIVSMLYMTPVFQKLNFVLHKTKFSFIFIDIVVIVLFIYAVMEMLTTGFNPFIYFRF